MRYELIDYQREAALACLVRLARGRDSWHQHKSMSSFALSAVTGAGKTVIATAVIEALIYGSADLGVDADPRALFLWVTDDPALNRQTKAKMLTASDLLEPSRLGELNDGFMESELRPGRVYFLNIQQLAKTAGFAKGGTNLRQHSGWDILRHTLTSTDRDLYLVLDEAHRGMKRVGERPGIVQRIIAGQSGSNPPVPVVWGISATIERFAMAMKAHEGSRDSFSPVAVDADKVRASGIIKDQIELDKPGEQGEFHATLLRSAVAALRDFEGRWSAYSEAENEPLVVPVLVVQVRDKVSEADLGEIVSIIESQWDNLGQHAVVNVFGEHADLVIGARKVRYVNPETIQENDGIRVVLAKEAISTGWDCPRAEVLFSERTAKDATHIAQVIGRMVRSPLARRITTDEALNSVVCFLPRFDRDAVTSITEALMRPGEPGEVAEIISHARIFNRNPTVAADVYDFVESLPSWPKPDVLASPLLRAKSLVKLLTDESSGPALMPDAGAQFTSYLNAKLDGLAAEHQSAVDAEVRNLETAVIERLTTTTTNGTAITTSTLTKDTALPDIDRETRKIVASMKEGIGNRYVAYRVAKQGDAADELAIRTRVAALIRVAGVTQSVNEAATSWVQARLADFDAEFKLSTGPAKAAWMRVKEMASDQEVTSIELPTTLKTSVRDGNEPEAAELPMYTGHLFADEAGWFPIKLNAWERKALETEIRRTSFVAWYRNPSRASGSALRIGYLDDSDEWQSLQVDFIVISKRPDGTLVASIIDPHGDHLGDAVPKLKALARFAAAHGDKFARIAAIAAPGGAGDLRVLDLLDPKVRAAVVKYDAAKATALYEDDDVAQAFR
jgi:type III restriction enzyme